MPRDDPTREECIEALQVMIEVYGLHRTKVMLEEATQAWNKEQGEAQGVEY